jgi:hypothetical protein
LRTYRRLVWSLVLALACTVAAAAPASAVAQFSASQRAAMRQAVQGAMAAGGYPGMAAGISSLAVAASLVALAFPHLAGAPRPHRVAADGAGARSGGGVDRAARELPDGE